MSDAWAPTTVRPRADVVHTRCAKRPVAAGSLGRSARKSGCERYPTAHPPLLSARPLAPALLRCPPPRRPVRRPPPRVRRQARGRARLGRHVSPGRHAAGSLYRPDRKWHSAMARTDGRCPTTPSRCRGCSASTASAAPGWRAPVRRTTRRGSIQRWAGGHRPRKRYRRPDAEGPQFRPRRRRAAEHSSCPPQFRSDHSVGGWSSDRIQHRRHSGRRSVPLHQPNQRIAPGPAAGRAFHAYSGPPSQSASKTAPSPRRRCFDQVGGSLPCCVLQTRSSEQGKNKASRGPMGSCGAL